MRRRILAVWPPVWTLAAAGLVYAIFQGACLFEEVSIGVPIFSMRDGAMFLLVIMTVFAILYAAYRAAAFHPAYRPQYYEWLCNTPWTSKKPLPLGPIHLVWQDVLLLASAFALAWLRAEWLSIVVIQGFLVAYFLILGFTHYFAHQKAWAYATLVGVGVLILYARDLPIFFISAALIYGIAYLGLRASLAAFPWREAAGLKQSLEVFKKASQGQANADRSLGWPYDRLGPDCPDDTPLSWDFKLVFGMLLGWWLFAVHSQLRMAGDPSNGYVAYYYFLLGGMVYRLATYCNGYLPPLDLHGRLTTGRLIVPGYDQVFAAPLCALGVGIAAWCVPNWFERIDPLYVTPLAFVLTWWILFTMPPSLKRWRLTGNHRIAPGLMVKSALP